MSFRKRVPRGRGKKSFSRSASRIHRKNLGGSSVMRGGIRL